MEADRLATSMTVTGMIGMVTRKVKKKNPSIQNKWKLCQVLVELIVGLAQPAEDIGRRRLAGVVVDPGGGAGADAGTLESLMPPTDPMCSEHLGAKKPRAFRALGGRM